MDACNLCYAYSVSNEKPAVLIYAPILMHLAVGYGNHFQIATV